MKLSNALMGSHLVVGVISGLGVAVACRYTTSPAVWVATAFITGFVGMILGLLLAHRMTAGLAALENAIAGTEGSVISETGLQEVDRLGVRLRTLVQRWMEAAASSREQTRELEILIKRLNRRGGQQGVPRGKALGTTLRQQLGSITSTATTELNQILNCSKEIERHIREIALGAQDQSDAVNKTTTYVEQMSANIDSVAKNAGAAQRAAVSTRDSASAALNLVRELIDGMNRIRTHVEASESRLRSLGDHSQEIGSIVEMIGAISSRTDMLALNASIESVRAGEHGRGFAVVAEEVRKLAEQAAQATREVAGLIESIQLETQESIALMAEEREEVEAEVARVNAAGDALERISQISSDSATQVGEITSATQLQLQLTQDVVLAVERISDVARASRKRAEEAIWTTNSLTKLTQQFDQSLRPLRDCVREDGDFDTHDGLDSHAPATSGLPIASHTTDFSSPVPTV
jgi:methyl-accepting chemotaxis protein